MKITKRQLRRIIKEEKQRLMSESRQVFLEDVVVGKSYNLGYRETTFTSKFNGWICDEKGPRMMWEDDEAGNWEAYMYKGYMAVGSSADRLKIFGVAVEHDEGKSVDS